MQKLDSDDDPDADELYIPRERRSKKPTTSLPAQSEPPPPREVSRVMDDEDAEFQAALKASLEGLSQDYVPSATPPRRLVHTSQPPPILREPPAGQLLAELSDAEDGDTQEESSGKGKAREESPEMEVVDMDEIRRRRLARFGGS
jgi:ataxin-3